MLFPVSVKVDVPPWKLPLPLTEIEPATDQFDEPAFKLLLFHGSVIDPAIVIDEDCALYTPKFSVQLPPTVIVDPMALNVPVDMVKLYVIAMELLLELMMDAYPLA